MILIPNKKKEEECEIWKKTPQSHNLQDLMKRKKNNNECVYLTKMSTV